MSRTTTPGETTRAAIGTVSILAGERFGVRLLALPAGVLAPAHDVVHADVADDEVREEGHKLIA